MDYKAELHKINALVESIKLDIAEGRLEASAGLYQVIGVLTEWKRVIDVMIDEAFELLTEV